MIWVPMQPAFERPIQSLSMSVVAAAGPWTVGKREQGIQLRFRDNLLCPEPLSQAEVQYPDTHSRSIEQLRFLNHRLIEQLRFLQWHQIRTVVLLLFFILWLSKCCYRFLTIEKGCIPFRVSNMQQVLQLLDTIYRLQFLWWSTPIWPSFCTALAAMVHHDRTLISILRFVLLLMSTIYF
jgi:hypothetical protein